jgi:flagellar basal-body rod modification protein FlgD
MAVDSLGTASAAVAPLSQATVDQSDLFKILLTQLKYQDPLKPTDNAAFIAQLAQFTSLDQARQTNDNMQALLQMQATSQSVGLIGRTVEIVSPSGNQVGQVTTISFDSGTPQLTIKTASGALLNNLSLSQLQVVR